ncbi:hypothetical protein NPIL_571601 [Nephila pilipes]|uniref:Uncharacterized protein n=1 Tax=Nephila pilipes TaxID=299642 RepID=A0A8X6PHH6_NEPPI|nr:hypothetical protein NPIL_571601 [Nephila pilipes]
MKDVIQPKWMFMSISSLLHPGRKFQDNPLGSSESKEDDSNFLWEIPESRDQEFKLPRRLLEIVGRKLVRKDWSIYRGGMERSED